MLVVIAIEVVVSLAAMEASALYHLTRIILGKESYGFFHYLFICISDISLNKDVLINLNIICAAINVCIIGFWYLRKYGEEEKKERSTLVFDKPKIFVALLALAAGLQFVSAYITDIVAFISPAAMEYYEELLEVAGLTGENITVMVVLYAIIIGPLSEELIFRGAILHIGAERLNFWVANILQAIFFGLFHMNLVQGVYAFVVGIFFGYVAHKSHSIKASYVFHLLFNFMGVFVGISTGANQILARILVGMFTIALLIVGKNLIDDGIRKSYEKEVMNE